MKRLLLPSVLCLFAAPALASTLAVNFGRLNAPPGTPSSPSEPGYGDAFYNDTASLAPTSVAYGTFGGVTLTVTSSGHATDNRLRSIDRGDSTPYSGALDTLTRSWIGTQTQGSALTLILSGVDPRPHNWTSYHFDNGTGLSGNGNQNGRMSIELSVDGGATFAPVAASFQIQDNEGTATSVIAPFSVDFTALAGQDVYFRFTNNALGFNAVGVADAGQDFTLINGFEIAAVPEPSALLFGVLGLVGLAVRRRR